jgi:GT2 family glycosyltransferase
MEKLEKNDISIVIATYNRSKDLEESLKPILKENEINEIIIVDQSNDQRTKNLNILKNKKIKYIHSKIPSLTRARNIGVKKSSKKSKIIVFLDDDATIGKKFFESILKIFNKNKEAIGIGVFVPRPERKFTKSEKIIRNLFFLETGKDNKMQVTSVYGNCFPERLDKIIEAQWLSGVNMAYRKEVFKKQTFDENLTGYALAEDFDFSYRLWKNHPGCLYLTPESKVIHRISGVGRYPTKKISYVNQINHFYLNFKNFNSNIQEKLIFAWCMLGIGLLRILMFIKTRQEAERLKMGYFYSSLLYCIMNLQKIRKGDLGFE